VDKARLQPVADVMLRLGLLLHHFSISVMTG
jgi:hypothetical protein